MLLLTLAVFAPIVRCMTNQSAGLDQVFQALSDPTRRAVLQRLVSGPASVSELARPFAMSLPSFVQHLGVLERAGLVRSKKTGRVRTVRVVPGQMRKAEHWLSAQREQWQSRLDQFDSYATSLNSKQEDP